MITSSLENKTTVRPFHVAFSVDDLEKTKEWYTSVLNCKIGRSSDLWVDFDLYGHQVVAHWVKEMPAVTTNPVDGDNVPSNHFGVILTMSEWKCLSSRLKELKIEFIIEPHIRFEGEVGEQATMFFKDPCGNALEFKAFVNDSMIFAS